MLEMTNDRNLRYFGVTQSYSYSYACTKREVDCCGEGLRGKLQLKHSYFVVDLGEVVLKLDPF